MHEYIEHNLLGIALIVIPALASAWALIVSHYSTNSRLRAISFYAVIPVIGVASLLAIYQASSNYRAAESRVNQNEIEQAQLRTQIAVLNNSLSTVQQAVTILGGYMQNSSSDFRKLSNMTLRTMAASDQDSSKLKQALHADQQLFAAVEKEIRSLSLGLNLRQHPTQRNSSVADNLDQRSSAGLPAVTENSRMAISSDIAHMLGLTDVDTQAPGKAASVGNPVVPLASSHAPMTVTPEVAHILGLDDLSEQSPSKPPASSGS